MITALLVGGPCDGMRVSLTQCSPSIEQLMPRQKSAEPARIQYVLADLKPLPLLLAVYRHTTVTSDEVLTRLVRGYPSSPGTQQGDAWE